MTRKLFLTLSLSVASVFLTPLQSYAVVLTYTNIPLRGEPARLYNVDTGTGVVSIRADLTIQDDYFAMDTRPSDGKLFLMGRDGDLYTADPNTGVTTWLGNTEVGDNSAAGLSFDPTTGKLYANRILRGPLYEISDIDGSTIATYPFGDFRSLQFNSQGELFARGRQDRHLYQINLDTGIWTKIGMGTVPGNSLDDALVDSTFVGDRLYSILNSNTTSFLYENDFMTGDSVHVADLPGKPLGLVSLPVPEPASLALAISVIMTAITLRRKR